MLFICFDFWYKYNTLFLNPKINVLSFFMSDYFPQTGIPR